MRLVLICEQEESFFEIAFDQKGCREKLCVSVENCASSIAHPSESSDSSFVHCLYTILHFYKLQVTDRYANPFFFFFSLWPRYMVCGILVPWQGIEPVPPAVEAQSPNHWTAREVPANSFFQLAFQLSLHRIWRDPESWDPMTWDELKGLSLLCCWPSLVGSLAWQVADWSLR